LIRADIKHEDSVRENLDMWCYERGTRFEIANEEAALEFINLIETPEILELGCGDGAASQYFLENNCFVVGIDINQEKLDRNPAFGIRADMYNFLKLIGDDSVENIFTHHALEHTVAAKEVVKEIGRVLKPGGYYYAVVPANDHLHTVHHVVFENSIELLPLGLQPIFIGYQEREEPEFKCIAQKPLV
jgi:SAM-dependent methyltransferase